MKIMNQGDEYEEVTISDDDADLEEEGSEDTDAGADLIFGFPKKIVFIAAAGIVVIIILAVVLLRGGSKDGGDDAATADDAEWTQDSVEQDSPFYDSAGNELGLYSMTTDGSFLYDMNYNQIGQVDAAGAMQAFDQSGNVLFNYSEVTPEPVTDDGDATTEANADGWNLSGEEDPKDLVYGSDEVTKQLRALGYTGDEIETAKSMGISVPTLIKNAEELRNSEAVKALKRMSKKGNKQFRRMLTYSVFGLPEIHYEDYDGKDGSMNYDAHFTVNADYWKVPTYGNQLQVKLKIANNTYCFMYVTPSRWAKLPDTGNMIVNVYFTIYGSKKPKMYITDVQEQDVTAYTVNTKDNATSLQQLIDEAGNDTFGITDDTEAVADDYDNSGQVFETIE